MQNLVKHMKSCRCLLVDWLIMTLEYCVGNAHFIGLFLLYSHFQSQYKNNETAKYEAAPPEYCNMSRTFDLIVH